MYTSVSLQRFGVLHHYRTKKQLKLANANPFVEPYSDKCPSRNLSWKRTGKMFCSISERMSLTYRRTILFSIFSIITLEWPEDVRDLQLVWRCSSCSHMVKRSWNKMGSQLHESRFREQSVWFRRRPLNKCPPRRQLYIRGLLSYGTLRRVSRMHEKKRSLPTRTRPGRIQSRNLSVLWGNRW